MPPQVAGVKDGGGTRGGCDGWAELPCRACARVAVDAAAEAAAAGWHPKQEHDGSWAVVGIYGGHLHLQQRLESNDW